MTVSLITPTPPFGSIKLKLIRFRGVLKNVLKDVFPDFIIEYPGLFARGRNRTLVDSLV